MSNKIEKEDRYEVTPIELFFDLVYALAISKLTEYLLSNLTFEGIIKTMIILIAMYMVWAYTSWAATMIRAEERETHWMILIVMLFSFLMNIFVADAFSSLGAVFAVTFLIIQFGRTFWTIKASPNYIFKEHFLRVLIWQFISAPFWIAGAVGKTNIRILLWLGASMIDLIGTWLAHPTPRKQFLSEEVEFDATHLLERCRLFRLIAIGEMVFTLGDAISAAKFSSITIVLIIVAMAEIVALWVLTFVHFFTVVREHVENTNNPVKASRYAINALVVILLGIIFISVANEQIIIHPLVKASIVLSFLLGAGPILFLLAQGWYLAKVPNLNPHIYIICILLLIIVSVFSYIISAWLGLVLVGTIVVVFSIIESFGKV